MSPVSKAKLKPIEAGCGPGGAENPAIESDDSVDVAAFAAAQDAAAQDGAATGQKGAAAPAGSTGGYALAGGLVFVNSFGAGVSEAFKAAVITAETFFQSHFAGSLTFTLSFDLQPIPAQFSGQNLYMPVRNVSYLSLVTALRSHAATPDQRAAVGSLPLLDPTGGAGFSISCGMARNLGLGSGASGGFDDSIVLNSNMAWSYGDDAVGVLEHEISEGVFGRTGGLGMQNGAWGPMDLFRYAAAGQRDYSGGRDGMPSYFSVDGAAMLMPFHNSVNTAGMFDNADVSDWDNTVSGDAFGASGPGAPGVVSATDMQVMDVLGWTPLNPSQALSFSINDTTTNTVTASAGEAYSGPIAGLQHQLIDITADSLNITAAAPNSFIHTGSGTDGIDVSKVNGNNVLDGATGSNFLIGGAGNDSFYMDDRNATAPIFSTIVNFHSGDNATVWGITPADFTMTVLDNQGAAGAQGLDLVFTAPGHVATSFVLAGFASADLSNGRLSRSYGRTGDLPGLPGSQYLTIHAT